MVYSTAHLVRGSLTVEMNNTWKFVQIRVYKPVQHYLGPQLARGGIPGDLQCARTERTKRPLYSLYVLRSYKHSQNLSGVHLWCTSIEKLASPLLFSESKGGFTTIFLGRVFLTLGVSMMCGICRLCTLFATPNTVEVSKKCSEKLEPSCREISYPYHPNWGLVNLKGSKLQKVPSSTERSSEADG